MAGPIQSYPPLAWVKYSFTYADFAEAENLHTINNVFSVGLRDVIHGFKIKHSEAFQGGTISSYTIDIYNGDTIDVYTSKFDVFQAPDDGTLQVSMSPSGIAIEPVNLLVRADCVGDNLDQATQGKVDIYVLIGRAG